MMSQSTTGLHTSESNPVNDRVFDLVEGGGVVCERSFYAGHVIRPNGFRIGKRAEKAPVRGRLQPFVESGRRPSALVAGSFTVNFLLCGPVGDGVAEAAKGVGGGFKADCSVKQSQSSEAFLRGRPASVRDRGREDG